MKKKKDAGKGDGKSRFQFNVSMKVQLLIGFLVPVIFVIMVGAISYRRAESGMAENYESAAVTAIDAQMHYLDFGLSVINADAVQMKLDSDLASLVAGTYKNDSSKTSSVYNKTLSSIKVKQTSNAFIKNIYIIPKSDNRIISTSGSTNEQGYYEQWAATEEGQYFVKGSNSSEWIGEHPMLDSMSGYSTEDYIMSYASVFSNKSAVLVVDISTQAVKDSLAGIGVDNGEILGFITGDGRELVIQGDEDTQDISFMEQDFFTECLGQEEISGTKYIKFNEKDYFFIFSKSAKTGASLVYMVPQENITANAQSIRSITVVMVIIACIAACVIGLIISANISISMNRIIKRLKKVSQGDLTVQFRSGGRDEFSILARHIMDMITNMRKLIQEVESIVSLVSEAAGDVEQVSGEMEESTKRIMGMLTEIDSGVSQQADDAQDCLAAMDSLSDSLENVGQDIERVYGNSETTKQIVSRGILTMEELTGKSKETTDITSQVKRDIHRLEEKTAVIGDFVNIINEIAGQTNLLSLNASIEAARVGESGKGFAVVAEEIRKLADGSLKAAQEIQKVVGEIQQQTVETVAVADKAETIVSEQSDIVGKTKEDFGEISRCTEELIGNIQKITVNIEKMDDKRKGTLEAISSISAASAQTAASSSGVHSIASGQTNVVESLKKASDKLKGKMGELETALSMFIIEHEHN